MKLRPRVLRSIDNIMTRKFIEKEEDKENERGRENMNEKENERIVDKEGKRRLR